MGVKKYVVCISVSQLEVLGKMVISMMWGQEAIRSSESRSLTCFLKIINFHNLVLDQIPVNAWRRMLQCLNVKTGVCLII